ncbi:hypothetical protein CWI38_0669p0020 [Hamiltosporidium tvaerminnensis]|uniref:Uncharacterized protein n=1 Tax=Hamiltosporidium tvaerminnensis TaxID=1176355 RepID=A0A4Q9LY89_9MICR|nr:hypothetical protein CWI38_0669p0020 [Hamiltosporidium tvaerminnensis]
MSINSNFIAAKKFIYLIETNKDREILFYEEIEDKLETIGIIHESFYMNVLNNSNRKSENKLHRVFTYKKNNFVNFELLKSVLEYPTYENLITRIECNFNLAYILKSLNDISSIPDEANIDYLNCLLLTLRSLKAIENKNISDFIRGISFRIFFKQFTNNSISEDLKLGDLFSQNELVSWNLYVKKLLIGTFLDYLMIKHDFIDENLVISINTKRIIDDTTFNKHIPYKSLLINDHKLFCVLENIFRNRNILYTFQILLHELNIKSLILDAFKISAFRDINHALFFPLRIFKAIMISNFSQSIRIIINELDLAINHNLEYFCLKNMDIDDEDFGYFLQKWKLKGLVLDNVETNNHFIGAYLTTNETLEYIEFKNVEMSFSWWSCFAKKQNTYKVIFSYNSNFEADNFIQEFMKLDSPVVVSHLEINFHRYKICKKFGRILQYFPYLKILNLSFYQSEIDFDKNLLEAIQKMGNLESFSIDIDRLNCDFFNCMFQNKKIEFLHFNNSYKHRQSLDLDSIYNYKVLSELYLNILHISENTLREICKCENLELFEVKDCYIGSIAGLRPIEFKSKNLKILHLDIRNLKIFSDLDILSELNCLEGLSIFGSKSYFCGLAYLNKNWDLKLRTFSYRNGILQINDLNRIKQFMVIEKLDLYKCKFIDSGFCQFGEDCKFLVSLKCLNLEYVKLNSNDIQYLKSFINLKILSIHFSEYHKIRADFISIPLKRFHFSSKKMFEKRNMKNLLRFLREENIIFDFINIY